MPISLRSRRLASLLMGASVVATATGAVAAEAAPSDVDQIVVTGTSIRGIAPVGASVITLDAAQVRQTGAQTVQQVLAGVPQVTGFNNVGQGAFGSQDAAGTNAPTIHSLGASASNGTLILIDGRRLPLSGVTHALADPNVIPAAAIQRVEVLPDGASAVYGSDAVAGVLNFITRRRFDGVETSAQMGFGDSYRTGNVNLLAGKVWDRGSAMAAYSYSYRSSIKNGERDFYRTDLRPLGGTNFNSFACAPAAVQPGATGGTTLFLAPYTGAAAANTNAPCNFTYDTDLIPREVRHSLLLKVEQKLSDRLSVTAELVYSIRNNRTEIPVGSVSNVVVFGPGSTPTGGAGQINPYFQGPAGTTVERVSFAGDGLFPNAINRAGAEAIFGTLSATYDLGSRWSADLGATVGSDDSWSRNYGVLCASCVILGLNGTTNLAGNPASASAMGPGGQPVFVTRLPITAATAVDVWNPGATNRTSATALSGLLDDTRNGGFQTLQNARLSFGGPAFAAPGGDVRVAIGGEGIRYSMHQTGLQSASAGPVTQNAVIADFRFVRKVWALFGETVVPLVGEANAMPLVRRLELSAAVRYDHYDDFGGTTNPKFAASWEPAEGLAFRGSYGTSFTAPALTSRGDDRGVTIESTFGASGQQVLPGGFPGASTLPGCAAVAAGGSCNIGGAQLAQGLQINGGNANLKAQTGDTWSLGADWRPSFVPRLRASLTYWDAKYKGMVSAPTFSQVVSSPGLYGALILNPTAAQVAAATAGLRQTTAVPTTVNFIYSFQQRNVANLAAAGIDVDLRYSQPSGFGDWSFGVAASYKVKFAQQYGSGTPYLSRLNTAGLNTAFSSIRFLGRASIGWDMQPVSATLFLNHTGGYWNRLANAVAISGPRGQRVASYTTIDAHLSLNLGGAGLLKDTELFGDAQNLFDQDPPYANVVLAGFGGGFNMTDSNPIGRVVSVGVRKAW